MSYATAHTALRVAVVDPRFDEHVELAAQARAGLVELHYRTSGADALRLARGRHFDAWLVAGDLDDMTGADFAGLLGERVAAGMTATPVSAGAPVIVIGTGSADQPGIAGTVTVEAIRRVMAPETAPARNTSWLAKIGTLPLGVTAAMMAITVLVAG